MIDKFIKVPKDPFDVVLWLLEGTGQLRAKQWSIWNRLMTLLGGFGTINGFIGPLLYACLADVSLTERTGSALNSSSGLHICTKFYNCYFRQRKVRNIIANARSLWDSQDIKDFKWKIKNESDQLSRMVIKAAVIIMQGLFLFMLINAFFTNFGKSRDEFILPYPNWLPLDYQEWFFTHCMWESYTMFIVSLNVSVDYALLFFLIVQASSHMKILSFMLETKKVDMKAIIRHHQKIISFVKSINELYSGQIFLELMLYGLQAGARGFISIQIVKSQTETEIGVLAFSLYITFLYILFSYLHCLSGQEITKQSGKLFVSAYQNSWYDLTAEDQKHICLIMCMTSKTLHLQYRHLMAFNMQRYAMIVQTMYSYMTLLMRMEL